MYKFFIVMFLSFLSVGTVLSQEAKKKNKKEVVEESDRGPILGKGYSHFISRLPSFLKISHEAKKAKIYGTINISFVVEEDGTLSNFLVVRDLGYNTGIAVIDAVQRYTQKFPCKPALKGGIPQRTSMTLPLSVDYREGL